MSHVYFTQNEGTYDLSLLLCFLFGVSAVILDYTYSFMYLII